jgi:hypothetical protein
MTQPDFSDLHTCLEYNPQKGFSKGDIKAVLAIVEGELDGKDWHWFLELNSGQFVYLVGGCDYSGWDCQSWATSSLYDSKEGLRTSFDDLMKSADDAAKAGTGHMLNLLSGRYGADLHAAHADLLSQLDSGNRPETWRERKSKELKP